MPKDLVRYHEVRVADVQDDQKSAAQIVAAPLVSITQEDFQNFVLSQLKRVIHGDYTGNWLDNFVAADLPSLSRVTKRLATFLDEGPGEGYAGGYKTIVGAPWPTAIVWWVDATQTQKIVEKLITRNADQAPTLIVWNFYADDGITIHRSATDVIVNTGTPAVFESTRTRTIT